jgi:hypothetical protein
MRMMGAVHVLKRQTEITYIEVEKDLAKRALNFEVANGLRPASPNFAKEFFGIASEMEDSHRVLFLHLARKPDNSDFQAGLVYDLESRTFSIPTPEEEARLTQNDFGIERGVITFHPLVLRPSATPEASATAAAERATNTNIPRLDLLKAKSLIAKSPDALFKAVVAVRMQNQNLLRQMVLDRDITIRADDVPLIFASQYDGSDYAEVVMPTLFGIEHVWVLYSDIYSKEGTPLESEPTPMEVRKAISVVASPKPTAITPELGNADDDLNRAWKALTNKQRIQLRQDERNWIRHRDSLPAEERIKNTQERAKYLWSLVKRTFDD